MLQLHQQHQQSETFYKGRKPEEQQDHCQCTPTFLNDLNKKEFQFKEVWKPGAALKTNNEQQAKLNPGKCGISICKGTIPNHRQNDDDDEEKATSNCRIFVERRNLTFHLNEAKSTENNFLSPKTRIVSLPTASCPITELNHYHWQYPIGKNPSSSSAPLATVAILEKTLLASPPVPLASESKTFCGSSSSSGSSNTEKDDNADDHPDCGDDGENKSSRRGSGVISYFSRITKHDKAAITNNEQTTLLPFIDNEHALEADTSFMENTFAVPRHECNSTKIHGLLVNKGLRLVEVAVGPSDSEIEHNEPGMAERMVEKLFPSSKSVLPSPPLQLLSLFSSSVASPSTNPPSSNSRYGAGESESTNESNIRRKRRAGGYITHKSAAFLLNLLLLLHLSHDRLLSGAEAGNIPLGLFTIYM